MTVLQKLNAITGGTAKTVGAAIQDFMDRKVLYKIDLSGVGSNVTVVAQNANNETLLNGDVVFNGSKVKFTVTYAAGYEKDTLTVGGSAYTSGTFYTVNATNVAIIATAKTSA